MQLTNFLPVALLSTLSFTTASPFRRDAPSLTWHVSDFSTGCSAQACQYKFNILGIATPNTPGFNTTCTGNDNESDYSFCKDHHVQSKLIPKTYPHWQVQVKHSWAKIEADAEYTTIGDANITEPIKKFDIAVSQEYGVA